MPINNMDFQVEYTCKELEEFYSSSDLTTRLKTEGKMSVTSLNVSLGFYQKHYIYH